MVKFPDYDDKMIEGLIKLRLALGRGLNQSAFEQHLVASVRPPNVTLLEDEDENDYPNFGFCRLRPPALADWKC